MATVFALVADIFPDLRERARYQGMLFSVFALSSVVGPVLGGWITDSFSWRWVFYINLPLGMLALAMLPIVLPQSVRQGNPRIDYLGALTSTIAVIALLLSLELVGAGHVWTSLEVISGFALALLAFAAFLPIELRAAEPIIPLRLFRNRTIAATSLVLFLVGIVTFGVILYMPLFVQGVLGLSASNSGLVMTPLVLTMVVMGIVIGQLIARFERLKPFLLFGTGMLSLGVVLLTRLTAGSSPLLVSAFLFVMALGMGTLMPVTTLAVQSVAEPRVLGVATSATQFIRSIGATVGTAAIGTLVTSGYIARLTAAAPQGVPESAITALHSPNALINQEALQRLTQLMAAVPNGRQLTQTLLEAARAALTNAVHTGFFVILGASLLAFASSFLIEDLRLGSRRTAHSADDQAQITTSTTIEPGVGH
jgi:MFS family permease